MIKEYMDQAGYRIRASEKAYNLFYRKNGFIPVQTQEAAGDKTRKTGKSKKSAKEEETEDTVEQETDQTPAGPAEDE